MKEQFLLEAIALAQSKSADGKNGPFAAIVVNGTEKVSEGWNRVVEYYDPTAHAEIVAIRMACMRLGTFQLAGCTIYCSCEPCPMCLSAIYWSRISEVVFAATREDAFYAGFDDSIIYYEMKLPWDHRSLSSVQILREQGRIVLESWKANDHKLEY